MKYDDENILNTSDLIDKLKQHLENTELPVWYRGQAKSEWKLIPKLLRSNESTNETFLISKFKQNASLLLKQQPKTEFEWLFLMQHHSMPTRLLDWTESPLVALYFAVSEINFFSDEGALWVMLPTKLNEFSHFRPDFPQEIPLFDDEHLQNYLPNSIARENRSHLLPMAALAQRNSTRMQSQQGVFTINHRDNIPIEKAGNGDNFNHIWRYLISPDVKPIIRKELSILSINRFQLFPELDSLANN